MTSAGPKKRQKTDHEINLRLGDPRIDADARNLENLRHLLMRGMVRRPIIDPSRPAHTLYARYRGNGFPLRTREGRKLPQWRHMSTWAKLQIATVALADHYYMNFTIHLHDDLRQDLVAKGKNLKDYIRDRITRKLRTEFGDERPGFLFVIEEHDAEGKVVRPHAHGSIGVPRIDIAHAPRGKRKLATMVAKGMVKEAELLAGRMVIRELLKSASGNGGDAARVAASGRTQSRNVWTKKPTFNVLTLYWVNYAFKNSRCFSPLLGEDREVLSHALGRQARDIWEVIRNGDKAVQKIVSR